MVIEGTLAWLSQDKRQGFIIQEGVGDILFKESVPVAFDTGERVVFTRYNQQVKVLGKVA